MVDADGVIAEAAWWLDHDDDVAELESCDVDVAGFWVCVVGSGGFAPVGGHFFLHAGGQGVEEGEVGVAWECEGVVGEDVVGEPFGVVSAGVNDGVHECVAVHGVVAGDGGGVAEVVACVVQGVEDFERGCWGVESDCVADAGVFGGVCGEHDDDLFVAVVEVAESGVVVGDACESGAAFGVGDVGDESVGVVFFEGEGDGDDAAVEFGDGDLGCHVKWGEAVVVGGPVAAGAGECESLDDGDVECC